MMTAMTSQYHKIADLKTYTSRMGLGVIDKLFFVDKVESEVIVDFGCADGLLIEHLLPWLPNSDFIGYDIDPEMIQAAKSRFAEKSPLFTDSWDEVVERLDGRSATLVLSSIVHEVYHYQEPQEIDQFWHRVFNSGFDFIVLRDMIPSRSIDRLTDKSDLLKIYRSHLHKSQLDDFENVWGSVANNRNLIHFLLKYRYQSPNWQREVKENYLPIYYEDLLSMIPAEYELLYHEHFVLPYTRRQVRKDIGINIKDPTHLKIILEKVQ